MTLSPFLCAQKSTRVAHYFLWLLRMAQLSHEPFPAWAWSCATLILATPLEVVVAFLAPCNNRGDVQSCIESFETPTCLWNVEIPHELATMRCLCLELFYFPRFFPPIIYFLHVGAVWENMILLTLITSVNSSSSLKGGLLVRFSHNVS